MGILSVGGPQNMLSLSDKRLALVYAAALEVFKRTGRITICSWYGDEEQYAAVSASALFPKSIPFPGRAYKIKEVDDGQYVLVLIPAYSTEPAPVPKPKAVKKVADLVEKHDCWLMLDKSDQIISTPKVIEEIKATAKCIDGVAYLKELNAQEEA